MNYKRIRILSYIPYFCFAFILFINAALICHAQNQVISGNCGENGDNVKWYFEDGTLTVKGSGNMINKPETDREMISPNDLDITLVKKIIIEDGVTSVGDYSFFWFENAKEATIADSVTYIGNYAFAGCPNLTSIKLSNSVTTIGKNAFGGCPVDSFDLPDSLTSIDDYAFIDCSYMTKITIPQNVTSIGEFAFAGCTSVRSATIKCAVTGCGLFKGCTVLSTVTMNPSIKKLEASCFCGCTNIKQITLPANLEHIGYEAFSGCTKLTSIDIPQTVTKIDENAFSGTPLTSVKLPDNLTEIPGGLFGDCQKLTSVTIPTRVTSIGNGAFQYCPISEITLPNGVKTIGNDAFNGCVQLTGVSLPNTLTTIGDRAFSCCSKLKLSSLPDSVQTIGESAFFDNKSIVALSLPASLKKLGSNAFNLERITLPTSLSTLSSNAFGEYPCIVYCTTQTQIDYCKDFDYTYIDASSPIDISNVTIILDKDSYTFNGTSITPDCMVIYNYDNQNITLKEGYDYTLTYSDNNKVGTGKLTVNGMGAFYGKCEKSFKITEDNSDSTVDNTTKPTRDNNNQTETTLNNNSNNSTNSAANNVSKNIDNIQNNELDNTPQSNSISSIYDKKTSTVKNTYLVGKAYYKITGKSTATYIRPKSNSYKSISIPATVKIKGKKYNITKVAASACLSNNKLTTIKIGDNVKIVCDDAFSKCKNLTTITFGKNVRIIGNNVLYNDKKLSRITIKGTQIKIIGKHTFKNVPHSVNIIVPSSKVKPYLRLINAASK